MKVSYSETHLTRWSIMLNLREDLECSPFVVDTLVGAFTKVIDSAAKVDEITPSEIISALVVLLDRSLRGARKFQDPTARFEDAAEISRVLNNLLIEHGRVPN